MAYIYRRLGIQENIDDARQPHPAAPAPASRPQHHQSGNNTMKNTSWGGLEGRQ